MRSRGVVLYVILWSNAVLCCSAGARPAETDLAPTNGVIPGCDVVNQSDPRIVSALCAPSLDGVYPEGQVYFLATNELIACKAKRRRFNIELNELLGGHLGVPLQPAKEPETETSPGDLVGAEQKKWRREFLTTVFEIRDSDVWQDGYRWSVFEILGSDFLQPLGWELIAKHVRVAGGEGRLTDVRRGDVALLVLHTPRRWVSAFRALAEATSQGVADSRLRELRLLAAIGLVCGGDREAGEALIQRTWAAAREQDNDEALRQVEEIRERIGELPDDEGTLRGLLQSWFELEYD